MAAVSLLSTHALSRNYGGLQAVKNVSLDISQGEVRALIGPNGAGKTTLVSMLCGRIPATSGQVVFEGRDVTTLPAHRRIALGMAYTFQITSVFAELSVSENVELAVQRHIAERQKITAQVDRTLERVGLGRMADRTAGDLAYGHQRLLEIAMGLGQTPKLLILDEPTQGLSDSEIEDFVALIRSVSEKSTVLLIEHNINVVMALADKITVLNFGEIIAEGTPGEIRANEAVQTAYLGG